MRCQLIAIGAEILSGIIVNSNSSHISARLCQSGFEPYAHTVVPDNQEAMKRGILRAFEEVDLVITTGGLGPTLDDITRKVAAELFSSDMVYSKEIAQDLIKRYGANLSSLRDQATIPRKAEILRNTIGTAPGFVFEENGKVLALLPGPPLEMKTMLEDELMPYLTQRFPHVKPVSSAKLYFINLTENQLDPLLRELQEECADIEIGIYSSYGTVTVLLKGRDEKKIAYAKQKLASSFETFLFEAPSGKIEEALIDELRKMKGTVAVAESCTGGLIAHKITLLPGSSDVFLGSLVVYSNELKQKILGVTPKVIQEHGAVSRQVVEQMVEGLFAKTDAQYAVAISGIAGPSGGSTEKPVGTVWLALAERGGPCHCCQMNWQGRSREVIITLSSSRALGGLYRFIKYGESLV